MTIDGKAASADNHLDVRNPATGQVFAAVPDAGTAELEAAIAAARNAFPAWRDTPWATRGRPSGSACGWWG
ncbi:MAG: aldehyde dehydrogenase family protein [Sphingomonadaceae bacterium]|nr:aldehyde dehydrogenase family protein [Sphingomonadaceae bacterium]